MSARSVVEHALRVYFNGSHDLDFVVSEVLARYEAEHAHELAEKQRELLRQGFRQEPYASVVNSLGQSEPLGTTHVIDHIDPNVTEIRPARVALAELYPKKEGQ